MFLDREILGQIAREAFREWAREQPNPEGGWLCDWCHMAEWQRESYRRIGEAVADAVSKNACQRREKYKDFFALVEKSIEDDLGMDGLLYRGCEVCEWAELVLGEMILATSESKSLVAVKRRLVRVAAISAIAMKQLENRNEDILAANKRGPSSTASTDQVQIVN